MSWIIFRDPQKPWRLTFIQNPSLDTYGRIRPCKNEFQDVSRRWINVWICQ